MTGSTPSHHSKPAVHVCTRPTSLEEDEWAFKWVLSEWKTAYITELGCLSFAILGLGVVLAGVGLYHFGKGVGLVLLAISVTVWIFFIIAYLRARLKAPSVMAGRSLGTLNTVSLPIDKAWKINPQRFQKQKGDFSWIVCVIPGVNVFLFVDRTSKPQPFISGKMPGNRIELDYYVYEEKGLVKLLVRQLHAIRIEGELELERVGEELQEPPILCYWLNSWQSQSEEEGYPREDRHAIENLLADLKHTVYADLCEVIDERPV